MKASKNNQAESLILIFTEKRSQQQKIPHSNKPQPKRPNYKTQNTQIHTISPFINHKV
jgi:hypothetical protein